MKAGMGTPSNAPFASDTVRDYFAVTMGLNRTAAA